METNLRDIVESSSALVGTDRELPVRTHDAARSVVFRVPFRP
jgi:hypothetical protein